MGPIGEGCKWCDRQTFGVPMVCVGSTRDGQPINKDKCVMMGAMYLSPLMGGQVSNNCIRINHTVQLGCIEYVYVQFRRVAVRAYKLGRLSVGWWSAKPVDRERLPRTDDDEEFYGDVARFETSKVYLQSGQVATQRSVRSVLHEEMSWVFGSLESVPANPLARTIVALAPPDICDSADDSDDDDTGGLCVFVPPRKRQSN